MMKKLIYTIILTLATSLVLSWAIPSLSKVITSTSERYPFVYYSSLSQRFMIRETIKGKLVHSDIAGNKYTREQYDSLTPLLNYKQLVLAGTMPDSILGIEVNPRILMSKTVIWKYTPRDIHRPNIALYLMYESMSGRANLEPPTDVFRLKDSIAFIDKLSNKINHEKSQLFRQRMEEEGFQFPARQVWGNLSARKPYDEGYFVLDNQAQLFHLKMVNGRPYVRNTKAGEQINIAYFDVLEVADKSIYGFILDKNGCLYTLNTDGYGISKFDIPSIAIDKDEIMLMGNLFYKMVNITTPNNCTYHVVDAQSLQQHDKPYSIAARSNLWETTASYLFPIYINLNSKYTDYIQPELKNDLKPAFFVSIFIAVIYMLFTRKKKILAQRIFNILFISIFGIPGLCAALIIK